MLSELGESSSRTVKQDPIALYRYNAISKGKCVCPFFFVLNLSMISRKVNVFVCIFKLKLVGSQSLQIQTCWFSISCFRKKENNLFKIKPLDDFQQERILTQASLVDWGFIRQAFHAKLCSIRGEGGFNYTSISVKLISLINLCQ